MTENETITALKDAARDGDDIAFAAWGTPWRKPGTPKGPRR